MSDKILRRWNDTPEIRKVDAETRTVEFVASDNSVDSYGTVLPVDKWDLTRYASNGIVGYMHDVYGDSWTKSADPDDVIGKGEALVEDGKLLVRITFEPADLNPTLWILHTTITATATLLLSSLRKPISISICN